MSVIREPKLVAAEVGRADFRPSGSADAICGALQRNLGLAYRYQPARMAIAKSLSIQSMPPTPSDSIGRSIRGETLFGKEFEEQALWIALIGQHAGRADICKRDLQELVAAHWCRGAAALGDQWDAVNGDFGAFVTRLLASKR